LKLRYFLFSDPDVALKTYVIVPRDYVDEALGELLKLGVFEAIPQEGGKRADEIREYIALVEKSRKIVDTLNSYIKEQVEVEVKEIPRDTRKAMEQLSEKLAEVVEIVGELDKKEVEYLDRLRSSSMLRKYLANVNSAYPEADTSLLDYEGALLTVKTLRGAKSDVDELKKMAEHVISELVLDGQTAITTLVFRRDVLEEVHRESERRKVRVLEISKAYGLEPLSTVIKRVLAEEEVIKSELEKLEASRNDTIKRHLHDIAVLKILTEAETSKAELLKSALQSKHMALVLGWIPRSKRDEVYKSLRDIPFNITFEEDPNPPVEFNNPKPFKPFEMFTELNGYPSPREWDPTPLLTYFYILFFALMFTDAGYAIGLIIGAKYILPLFVQNPETLKKLRRIVYITAVASIVTGVLSGSFLGSLIGRYISLAIPVQAIPSMPPGLRDHRVVADVVNYYIKLALLLGYIVVLISHFIGFLKAFIKARDLWSALLEVCIVVIMIFGPAYVKWRFNVQQNIDVFNLLKILPVQILEFTLYAVLLLLILAKVKSTGFMGIMLWIFDVVGIMGDTFSFIRIAGIALGGMMLAEIFNNFVYGAMSSLSSISVGLGIAAGICMAFMLHLFNLASSVLGPYIHSLRLILYEMSSKFYEGSGRKLSPVKIVLGTVSLGVISR
jgi:V/A-type H+-transporting ATPase subunit I